MTNLPPDLEALMPEPLALVAQFCGTWRESESVHSEPVFSANQVRSTIAAMIEALCARVKAADDKAMEGDYMLDSNDCIEVLRGTWSWGKDAASTGRGEGGEGA